jgi:Holliday junction DNA helicase RuvB
MVGKGAGATAIPLHLPQFTLIGATTRAGLLPSPLRDRFGFTAHLDFYEGEELADVVKRSAELLTLNIDEDAATELGRRSRGTPRIANRLLRRVRDYAEVHGDGDIDLSVTQKALNLYEVDALGLDRLDRAVLRVVVENFNGGPVGVANIAMAVGEETGTVEEMAEPFLVRAGLLQRTPRGRIATEAGFAHLGIARPGNLFS